MSKKDFCGLCGYDDVECKCALVMRREVCGIRAAGGMIGYAACELEWGHDGEVHSNGGDCFHSRATLDDHKWRQKIRRSS